MRDLKVTGVDGTDLQLADEDGGRYRLAVDDRLRESMASATATTVRPQSGSEVPATVADVQDAARPPSTAPAAQDRQVAAVPAPIAPPSLSLSELPHLPPGELVTPRTVQELLRSGHSAHQVAAAADWELAKVERYAAPIEAERSYIAGLAQDLPVAASAGDAAATIGERVAARLHDRGVAGDTVAWDSHRMAGRGWVVVCRFSAGGRTREASWQFRPATRTLTAIDDEARWLGEDERASGGPIPAPVAPVKVFDVEAEGGVTESAAPVDLVTAMQTRSRDRRARGSRGARSSRAGRSQPVASNASDLPTVADPGGSDQQTLPQQPGQTGHETDRADTSELRSSPTVDDLGHDPVTGTVDLFVAADLAPGDPTEGDVSHITGGHLTGSEVTGNEVTGSATSVDLRAAADPDEVHDTDTHTDQHPADSAPTTPRDMTSEAGSAVIGAVDAAQQPADPTHSEDSAGVDERADDDDPADSREHGDTSDNSSTQDNSDAADAADAADSPIPPRRPAGARSGRPSVPSWDDIMFGGRRGRD